MPVLGYDVRGATIDAVGAGCADVVGHSMAAETAAAMLAFLGR